METQIYYKRENPRLSVKVSTVKKDEFSDKAEISILSSYPYDITIEGVAFNESYFTFQVQTWVIKKNDYTFIGAATVDYTLTN